MGGFLTSGDCFENWKIAAKPDSAVSMVFGAGRELWMNWSKQNPGAFLEFCFPAVTFIPVQRSRDFLRFFCVFELIFWWWKNLKLNRFLKRTKVCLDPANDVCFTSQSALESCVFLLRAKLALARQLTGLTVLTELTFCIEHIFPVSVNSINSKGFF